MKYLMLSLTAVCGTLCFTDFATREAGASPAPAPAPAAYRQYYSSWTYHPTRRYHYCRYYYKPYSSYSGYQYHYAVRYPRTYSTQARYSRYVYFYNPRKRVYWGRFDLEGQPGKQYSLLKNEDRKESLDDIPEKAFPAPAAMPVIPESKDNTQIQPIDPKSLPADGGDDLPPAP